MLCKAERSRLLRGCLTDTPVGIYVLSRRCIQIMKSEATSNLCDVNDHMERTSFQKFYVDGGEATALR